MHEIFKTKRLNLYQEFPFHHLMVNTSVFGVLIDEGDKRFLYTEKFLLFGICRLIELHINEIILKEIKMIPDSIKTQINNILYSTIDIENIKSPIKINNEIRKLSNLYRKELRIPLSDSLIIASTSVNKLDGIISWDVRHVVNPKNRNRINEINQNRNYKEILLLTPEEYVEKFPYF